MTHLCVSARPIELQAIAATIAASMILFMASLQDMCRTERV
jgi:hypothetical protein